MDCIYRSIYYAIIISHKLLKVSKYKTFFPFQLNQMTEAIQNPEPEDMLDKNDKWLSNT